MQKIKRANKQHIHNKLEQRGTFKEVRHVLQLRDVPQAIATAVDQQRENAVVFTARVRRVELRQLGEDHVPFRLTAHLA